MLLDVIGLLLIDSSIFLPNFFSWVLDGSSLFFTRFFIEFLERSTGRAIALLAAASAREAQLDAADQVFLKRLQGCSSPQECAKVKDEYNKSRQFLQNLEQQTLQRATNVLENPQPKPQLEHLEHLPNSAEWSLRKDVLIVSLVGLAVALLWTKCFGQKVRFFDSFMCSSSLTFWFCFFLLFYLLQSYPIYEWPQMAPSFSPSVFLLDLISISAIQVVTDHLLGLQS